MHNGHIKTFWILAVSGILIFSSQTQLTAQVVDNSYPPQSKMFPDKNNEEKPKYAKDRFIVKFKSEGSQAVKEDVQYLLETNARFQDAVSDASDSLDNLFKKHNIRQAKSVFIKRHGLSTPEAQISQKRLRHLSKVKYSSRSQRASKDAILPDLSNVYLLEVSSQGDIEQIVREFQADPHVEYAQPDYTIEAFMVPNDPYYSSFGSWGQLYDDLWGLKKIRTEQAWDITQGEGTVVAVVDTGLDYNHPDIAANVWTNPDEIAGNGIDDDNNGFIDDLRGWDFAYDDNDPMDGHGHGTHVSGTIAAVGNNSLGIIGVAPKANIMPIKGLNDLGSGYGSWLANAIVYAAQNGADVMNNSWACSICPSYPVLEDAVRTAHGFGGRGGICGGQQQR
jgi:hypothetical protein